MSIRFLCTAVLSAVLTLGVSAGDLNPPGSPASTMLTLEDINSNLMSASGLLVSAQNPRTAITALPVTLEAPGSYYLRRNLTGVMAVNCSPKINLAHCPMCRWGKIVHAGSSTHFQCLAR